MKSSKVATVIPMVILAFMVLVSNHMNGSAFAKSERYVLVYDRLYEYSSNASDVLRKFIELRTNGADVVLLQADEPALGKGDKDARFITFPSSFESNEKYHRVLHILKGYKVMTYNGQGMIPGEKEKDRGVFIAVTEVYPFSDLNKLMDLSERLHDRGIEFIVSIMPIYDNYQFKAFQKFVDVLMYVGKKGGKFFIHFPVVNYEGTYNLDPTPLFKKAVQEYRKRGLDIVGITLPQNKMLNDLRVYDGLELPFILVTENEGKINAKLDLFKVSQALNDYIVIKGIHLDRFDYFGYREKKVSLGEQAIVTSLQAKEDKLFHMLSVLEMDRIPVRNFRVSEYRPKLRSFGKHSGIFEEQEKSQHEKFLEEEMRKIRGENVEEEKFAEGYDISSFSRIVIKMAIVLLGIFSVMVIIGRRFNYRKFLKDPSYKE